MGGGIREEVCVVGKGGGIREEVGVVRRGGGGGALGRRSVWWGGGH